MSASPGFPSWKGIKSAYEQMEDGNAVIINGRFASQFGTEGRGYHYAGWRSRPGRGPGGCDWAGLSQYEAAHGLHGANRTHPRVWRPQ